MAGEVAEFTGIMDYVMALSLSFYSFFRITCMIYLSLMISVEFGRQGCMGNLSDILFFFSSVNSYYFYFLLIPVERNT
jgi:hypothetical protein